MVEPIANLSRSDVRTNLVRILTFFQRVSEKDSKRPARKGGCRAGQFGPDVNSHTRLSALSLILFRRRSFYTYSNDKNAPESHRDSSMMAKGLIRPPIPTITCMEVHNIVHGTPGLRASSIILDLASVTSGTS
ncbi:hypothetical protein AZE42_11361 [Rhizopogon vesiculosus]|uniref:Uncharacterized protein n=1 Tax=Rhizopogon vesiculosus TaxID=180088 RepID=A0A1J8Q3M9_9AGAM|nr:hypothetical protein AZE42_11361 [Rhizopogon vesiculosus]